MSVREELRQSLPGDKEFRHTYADEILNLLVCSQIKVLREQRGETQESLAKLMRTTQTAISRLESVNYSAWNINTLRKVANALDVRLRITFEGFGTLWRDVRSLSKEKLSRHTIDQDPEFTHTISEEAVATPDDAQYSLFDFKDETKVADTGWFSLGSIDLSVATPLWDDTAESNATVESYAAPTPSVKRVRYELRAAA
jgi:transcriptional regulator with XRE-family HTH domain